MVLAGNLNGNVPNPGNYFTTLAGWGFTQAQFDASNLAVDVSDDGFDNSTTTPNHFVLYRNGDKTQASRLIYRVTQGTPGNDAGQGNNGHGQLNGSIIGGFVPTGSVTVNGNTTTTTGFPHADAQGFRYGLGVAPFVKLGNSTIFDSTAGTFTNPDYNVLQSAAYAAGARISSNSWGAPTNGVYNSDSQAYDNLVRDAQTGVAGNQGMVIVFSAGNNGSGATTIGTPGTGKNLITVGAAEGVRSHNTAVGGTSATGADGCGIADTGADSANDIISFSSRGPCTDGRVKPDIMAGGTHITGVTYVTATSTLNGTAAATYRASGVCGLSGSGTIGAAGNFFPQGEQWYSTSSGTSHSCPAVAGAATLVFQQFINNPAYLANRTPAGANPPSPALVKAYLMNSARYMTGVSANDVLPSNSQGMGHANLGTAFDGVSRAIRDQHTGDRFHVHRPVAHLHRHDHGQLQALPRDARLDRQIRPHLRRGLRQQPRPDRHGRGPDLQGQRVRHWRPERHRRHGRRTQQRGERVPARWHHRQLLDHRCGGQHRRPGRRDHHGQQPGLRARGV